MPKSSAEIHSLFRSGVPDSDQAHVVRCALEADQAAWALVRSDRFLFEQGIDLYPYIRRADFETRLRRAPVKTAIVRVAQNSRRTSSFVEMRTDQVVLTALTRSRPPTQLPKALYRQTRAEQSQLSLFGEESTVGDRLYGVFVFGGRRNRGRGVPFFARVYFPLPGSHLLTVQPLDLLSVHASVLDRFVRDPEKIRPTEETSELVVSLKKQRRENEE